MTYEDYLAAVLTALQAGYGLTSENAEQACYANRKGIRIMHANAEAVEVAAAWIAGTIGEEPAAP